MIYCLAELFLGKSPRVALPWGSSYIHVIWVNYDNLTQSHCKGCLVRESFCSANICLIDSLHFLGQILDAAGGTCQSWYGWKVFSKNSSMGERVPHESWGDFLFSLYCWKYGTTQGNYLVPDLFAAVQKMYIIWTENEHATVAKRWFCSCRMWNVSSWFQKTTCFFTLSHVQRQETLPSPPPQSKTHIIAVASTMRATSRNVTITPTPIQDTHHCRSIDHACTVKER